VQQTLLVIDTVSRTKESSERLFGRLFKLLVLCLLEGISQLRNSPTYELKHVKEEEDAAKEAFNSTAFVTTQVHRNSSGIKKNGPPAVPDPTAHHHPSGRRRR
jgi:hypothetical protein